MKPLPLLQGNMLVLVSHHLYQRLSLALSAGYPLYGSRSFQLTAAHTKRSYRYMVTDVSSSSNVGDRSSVCHPLKRQRLLRGWSQKDVAEALYRKCAENGHPEVGINEATANRWENGRCKPSPLYRKHLCTLYGLTAAQLGLLDGWEAQG